MTSARNNLLCYDFPQTCMLNPIHKIIPWAMVLSRALLGPGIILIGLHTRSGVLLIGGVVYALASDIYDGILARRWNTDTSALRMSDSIADTIFYISIVVLVWLRYPDAILENRVPLITVISLELARYIFDALKFRRAASYHSYMAKAWGLLLATATIALLGFGYHGRFISFAIWFGVLCDLEGLIMSIILPTWHRDVRTLAAALRLARR